MPRAANVERRGLLWLLSLSLLLAGCGGYLIPCPPDGYPTTGTAAGFYNDRFIFSAYNGLLIFDTKSNSWLTTTNPSAVASPNLLVSDSRAYLAGGERMPIGVSGYSAAVSTYDLNTSLWSSIGFLSAARSGIGSTVAGNKLFFAGGSSYVQGSGGYVLLYSDALDIYDLGSSSWLPTRQLSEARSGIVAATSGGFVVLAGGYRGFSSNSFTVDIYQLSTGLLTQTIVPVTPFGGLSGVGLPAPYVGVWMSAGNVSIEIDPSSGAVTAYNASDSPIEISGFAAEAVQAGGQIAFLRRSLDTFDPSTQIWQSTPLLAQELDYYGQPLVCAYGAQALLCLWDTTAVVIDLNTRSASFCPSSGLCGAVTAQLFLGGSCPTWSSCNAPRCDAINRVTVEGSLSLSAQFGLGPGDVLAVTGDLWSGGFPLGFLYNISEPAPHILVGGNVDLSNSYITFAYLGATVPSSLSVIQANGTLSGVAAVHVETLSTPPLFCASAVSLGASRWLLYALACAGALCVVPLNRAPLVLVAVLVAEGLSLVDLAAAASLPSALAQGAIIQYPNTAMPRIQAGELWLDFSSAPNPPPSPCPTYSYHRPRLSPLVVLIIALGAFFASAGVITAIIIIVAVRTHRKERANATVPTERTASDL